MLVQYLAGIFIGGIVIGWVLGWLWSRSRLREAMLLYQRERLKLKVTRYEAQARLDEQRKIFKDLK